MSTDRPRKTTQRTSRAISRRCSTARSPGRPATPPPPASTSAPASPSTQEVHFRSGAYDLRGVVLVPDGKGPFPVIVYNHGSERRPSLEYSGELGRWFQSKGYVVFVPYRRGASGSEGPHWEDEVLKNPSERERLTVEQLEAQNDDVLAAVEWVRAQVYADPEHVAVAGCSFGGIETVLTAERSPHVYAAIDFAGAAMTWASSKTMQERMRAAVRNARAPVFFVQAENDFNTSPSIELSGEMDRANKPHAMRIFPPHGTTPRQGHAHFCNHGMGEWGDDVLAFLRRSSTTR